MTDDYDDYDDAPQVSRLPRWIAATVMISACVGFVGLAYYAYHAGTRAMRDEDVALVEADSSPVKQKPADPGGMKFPNQDKTIFEAVASQPQRVAPVERVLPGPEEAVNREQMASNGKDWINDRLNAQQKPEDAPEALIEKSNPVPTAKAVQSAADMAPAAGEPDAAAAQPSPEALPPAVAEPAPALNPAQEAAPVDLTAPAPAPESPRVELKKEAPEAAAHKSAPMKKASGSHKGMVQLGSYKSEAEAGRAWKKLHGKYGSLLSGKADIAQANLGQKGTFYRLRTTASNPKSLCQSLTSKGQACIVVK